MSQKDSATAKEFLQMSDFLVEKGYRLGPRIGEGSYAKVRIIERIKDGKILAVKIIDRAKAPKDFLERFLPRELKLLVRIDHEYIVTTHEIIQTSEHVFIVMDYAEKGDLLDYVRKHGALPDQEAKNMFQAMAQAVKYLHDLNIAHRDLKCENILLMKDMRVKLSDFGFARSIPPPEGFKFPTSRTFCGSAAYASPDLLQGIPYNPKCNDVWSLGCILYIMVCASMPFDDSNVRKLVKQQLQDKIHFPSKVSDKVNPLCKNLIRQILDPDSTKRLNIAQVLDSDWLCMESPPPANAPSQSAVENS